MKKNAGIRKWFVLGLFVAVVMAGPVASLRAEDEKPTGDVTAGLFSQYVWRGYELSRNSIVIQPSVTVGYKGFSANLWGNLDTAPYSAGNDSYTGTWNETDLTLSYSTSVGPVTLGAGYIYYGLASMNKDAGDRDDSQELFVTASYDTLLSPTLTIYKEFDHYRNWYFLLGISHSFALSDKISLDLAATASYLLSTDAEKYPKFDGNGATTEKFSSFHDGTVSASLPIQVTDQITIKPTLSYIFPLTSDAKDEMKGLSLKGDDSSFLVGAVLVSYSF